MKQILGRLAFSVHLLSLLNLDSRNRFYRIGWNLWIFFWIRIWISTGHIGDISPFCRLVNLWYNCLKPNLFAFMSFQGSKLPCYDIVTSHGSSITNGTIHKSQSLRYPVGDNHICGIFI